MQCVVMYKDADRALHGEQVGGMLNRTAQFVQPCQPRLAARLAPISQDTGFHSDHLEPDLERVTFCQIRPEQLLPACLPCC